ncbi:MAG: hypothetical protein NTZ56_04570 [Acidobacteria bacterium]|nr:hypothetical protein [Acidobacteriota bacterium]
MERILGLADAVIVMPDFTRVSYPEMHAALVRFAKNRAIPIVRYYPEGFEGNKEHDYQVLPFTSAYGVVQYASEFLLSKAVDRGRVLEARVRLTRNVAIVAGCLVAAVLGFGAQLYSELDALRRLMVTPADIQQRIARSLYRFRIDSDSRAIIKEWAMIHADELTRISGNPNLKQLFIYVPVGKDLIPVGASGTDGQTLSINESIAGCAITNRVIVWWRGIGEKTLEMKAWELTGQSLGSFQKDMRLALPSGAECGFQKTGRGDAMKQLLCLPAGVDRSSTSPNVPAAVCLQVDDNADYVTSWWLRVYLLWEAYPIGLLNTEALLQAIKGKDRFEQTGAISDPLKPSATRSKGPRPALSVQSRPQKNSVSESPTSSSR